MEARKKGWRSTLNVTAVWKNVRTLSATDVEVENLVRWCFEPSQPQRITSGLNTNFTPFPSYSFHKSSYHKSCFLSLFIICGHSTWEPASSRVTYFILRAYTGTKISGEVLEKMQVNGPEEIPGSKRSMYGYILTYSGL